VVVYVFNVFDVLLVIRFASILDCELKNSSCFCVEDMLLDVFMFEEARNVSDAFDVCTMELLYDAKNPCRF
jgi:hypothetical protein